MAAERGVGRIHWPSAKAFSAPPPPLAVSTISERGVCCRGVPKTELAFWATESHALPSFLRAACGGGAECVGSPNRLDAFWAALLVAIGFGATFCGGGGASYLGDPNTEDAPCAALLFWLRLGPPPELAAAGGVS